MSVAALPQSPPLQPEARALQRNQGPKSPEIEVQARVAGGKSQRRAPMKNDSGRMMGRSQDAVVCSAAVVMFFKFERGMFAWVRAMKKSRLLGSGVTVSPVSSSYQVVTQYLLCPLLRRL